MRRVLFILAAISLAALTLLPSFARADDDRAPPAPETPAGGGEEPRPFQITPAPGPRSPEANPPVQTIVVKVVVDDGRAQAQAAPSTPSPQAPAAELASPQAQAQQLQPQAVTLQLVPSGVPAAAAPVAGRLHYPGPMKRAVGNLGEWMSHAKYATVKVPVPDPTPPIQAVHVVTVGTPARPAAATAPEAVLATPQAARKGWFGLNR